MTVIVPSDGITVGDGIAHWLLFASVQMQLVRVVPAWPPHAMSTVLKLADCFLTC